MGIAVSVENGLQRQAGYWTIILPTLETRGLRCALNAHGVPDSSRQCAPACYNCSRSKVGSWTSYDPSPWVAGPQLVCCWGWRAWVSEWQVGQRKAERQSTLGSWQRWQGSWASSSEGG